MFFVLSLFALDLSVVNLKLILFSCSQILIILIRAVQIIIPLHVTDFIIESQVYAY